MKSFFILLVASVIILPAFKVNAIERMTLSLEVKRAVFCNALEEKINSLSSIEEQALTFANGQSGSSARGYSQEICQDAWDFYEDVCNARVEAEYYNLENCGEASLPSYCNSAPIC
jgi:hypothetical protein